jgi:phenylpropionate dioxygenase-like ring-hydroxylating dioxygenase large terminal subunit
MPRFPHPVAFPGWYRVAHSEELGARAVRPVRVFGQDLVLMRGEDGAARLFDAYCPHLGAHLGYGGAVVGNGLRCPFHGWRFDDSGSCVSIPYAPKIPPRAALPAWQVHESDGVVYAWYDQAGRAPGWTPPRVAEHGHPAWDGPSRSLYPVRTHALEIAENLVDRAHFQAVHGIEQLPDGETAAEGHRFRSSFALVQRTPRGDVPTTIDNQGHGVGIWHTRFEGIIPTVLHLTIRPVEPEAVDVALDFYVRGSRTDEGIGAAMIREIRTQFEQDVVIWEHKMYRETPLLCATESGLPAIRRWAREL